MDRINQELLVKIKKYIDEHYIETNETPTVREIAAALSIGNTTAYRYLNILKDRGDIEYDSGWRGKIKTEMISKIGSETSMVGLVGSVSCGPLTFAEQNIVEYFKIPTRLLGHGVFYALQAKGKSMIKAGIDDGDYVIIRKQNTADEGQIVVALVGEEATLKRYYKDKKNRRVRLHPENDELEDIYMDDIQIQGIAVRVFKELN
jgi:repressor LexA